MHSGSAKALKAQPKRILKNEVLQSPNYVAPTPTLSDSFPKAALPRFDRLGRLV
jgi:hypothetical protein